MVVVTTSYLLLLVSFGTAIILVASWSILQYYPLNGCMECIKDVPALNISCIVLGMCLLILSAIGFLDELSDVYTDNDAVEYPLWLSSVLLVASLLCLSFVACVKTKSVKIKRIKDDYLKDHYFDKLTEEESNDRDYKCEANKHRLSEHIPKSTTGLEFR